VLVVRAVQQLLQLLLCIMMRTVMRTVLQLAIKTIQHSPTLLARWPCSSLTASTWSRISWAAKLRAKPPLPVAQKVQRMGQPTWQAAQDSTDE
jgi:hypothetical protein